MKALKKERCVVFRTQAYRNVAAIMMGPFVLAGLTNFSDVIAADPAKVEEWVMPSSRSSSSSSSSSSSRRSLLLPSGSSVERHGGAGGRGRGRGGGGSSGMASVGLGMEGLALTAVGRNRNYTLVPLNRMVLENYTVYFNVTGAD